MPYGKRIVDHSHVTRVPILRLDNPSKISSDDLAGVNMRDHSSNKTKNSWFNPRICLGNMFQDKQQNFGGNHLTFTENTNNSEIFKNLMNQKMMDNTYPVFSSSEEKLYPLRQSASMNTKVPSFHPAIVAPTFGSFVSSSTMSQQVYIPKMSYCNFKRCYQHKFKQKYLRSVACNPAGANHKKYFHKQFVKQCDKTVKPALLKTSVESSPQAQTVLPSVNDVEKNRNKADNQCDEKCVSFESKVSGDDVVSNWFDLCTDDESDEAETSEVPDSWDEDDEQNNATKNNDCNNTNANITVRVGHMTSSVQNVEGENNEEKNPDSEKIKPHIKIQIKPLKSETEEGSKHCADQNDDKSFILFLRKENKKCRPSAKKRRRSKAKKTDEEVADERQKETLHKESSPKCQNAAVAFMFGFNQTSEDFDSDKSPTHSFYMTFEEDEQLSDWSEDDECSDESLSDSDLFCSEFASPLNLNLICSVKQPEDSGLSKQLKEINLAWQVQLCRKSSSSSLNNGDKHDKAKKSGKKVHFAENGKIAKVHPMITWTHAYQEARKGPWRQYAIDHERFQRRIEESGKIISPVLLPEHRNKIYETLTES